MNTTISFPPPEPTLKLPRQSAEKWVATLAEERRRLHEDQEALREREQNLREYEARLRALQAEIDASRPGSNPPFAPTRASNPPIPRPSQSPFQEDPALQAAWEKLHRAREILEAEQIYLRDERIRMQDQDAAMKAREEAVAAREQRVAQREALVLAASPEIVAEEKSASAVSVFTRAPFNLARSMLGAKKAK